ncbi:glycosyltransferase family 4 protein [Hymenobacter sp. BT683]|uniref:Glycosyltransferase family 4 protein n=1 Tax=Hymenobacter jeongseonensis TaxID=2791027 RepID=A0ABS0IEH5_9BACT|nr:glycosyltransferase family 4 protein [Hymenobacter jeongseonensis]MBF9236255.1 glycosyltransferase family 4 protein [Hymenobacter jeongseonensis]
MRILLSAYACDPTHGGEDGNGFNWAWELAARGHEVYCFTAVVGRENILARLADSSQGPSPAGLHFVFVGVPAWVDFLYRWQFGVYLHYMVWQYRAWRAARPYDARRPFDLVHHVTFGSLQFASWLWRLGRPMVFGPIGGGEAAPKSLRRYLPNWFKTETMRNAISWLLVTFDPNVRQTLRRSALVLASNRETVALARRLGAARVELAMNAALPLDYFPAAYPPRAPLAGRALRILWVARLFPRKGLHLVLEALGRVNPGVEFHLDIYGDGPVAELVPGWIAAAGLQARVTWHGGTPYGTLRDIYLSHDLFMLCSLRDAYGVQYLEAMAMGLPILSLDHHGAADFIPKEAGIKVPVGPPEATTAALARAVEHLYHHPAELEQMGRAGCAFATQYGWPALVEGLLERVALVRACAPPTVGQQSSPLQHSTRLCAEGVVEKR